MSKRKYNETVSTVIDYYQEQAFLKKIKDRAKKFWSTVKSLRGKLKKARKSFQKRLIATKFGDKNRKINYKKAKYEKNYEDEIGLTDFEKLVLKHSKSKSKKLAIQISSGLKALSSIMSVEEFDKALKAVYKKDLEKVKAMKNDRKRERKIAVIKYFKSSKFLIHSIIAGAPIALMSIASVLIGSTTPIAVVATLYLSLIHI